LFVHDVGVQPVRTRAASQKAAPNDHYGDVHLGQWDEKHGASDVGGDSLVRLPFSSV
jgi:hypothetical protein